MSVSFSDVRVVARAAVVLVWVRRSLRDSTYHEVRELLANRLSSDGEEAGNRDRFDEARRVGQLVNGVANKLPLDLNCVPRTLTTWYLLGRRGIIADMPVPGASAAGNAMQARDRANARTETHDTIR